MRRKPWQKYTNRGISMQRIDEVADLEEFLDSKSDSAKITFKSSNIYAQDEAGKKKKLTRWLNKQLDKRYLVIGDFLIQKYNKSPRNHVYTGKNILYMSGNDRIELVCKTLGEDDYPIRKFFNIYEEYIQQQLQIERLNNEISQNEDAVSRIVRFCKFHCETGGVQCENRHCPLWTKLNKQRQIDEIKGRTTDQTSIA